jgi:putative SOS response-associated peptidase YedK
MCGRFYFITPKDELERYLPEVALPETLPLRYNIAPTQPVPVVCAAGTGQQLALFRWGLIPSWAKDETIGYRLINARAETLTEKPSFRSALQRRRCAILASGFYEWAHKPGSRTKEPYAFRLREGAPMLLAGLWETWTPVGGTPIKSCTIITTSANTLMAPFHDRMPVILEKPVLERWLDPALREASAVNDLLVPYPAELMETIPVSTRVNNPGYDMPDCLDITTAPG